MKFLNGIKIFLFVSVFTVSINCMAGAEGKGGADSVSCENWFGSGSVQLADFTGVKNKSPWMFDFLSSGQSTDLARKYLEQYRPEEALKIEAALKELTWKEAIGPLENLPTGFKVSRARAFFKGCKKVQLAIQDPDGTVTYSDSLEKQMSPLEQGFFPIHEAYVRIALKRGDNLEAAETYARKRTGSIYGDKKRFNRVLYQPVTPMLCEEIAMKETRYKNPDPADKISPYDTAYFMRVAGELLRLTGYHIDYKAISAAVWNSGDNTVQHVAEALFDETTR